MKSFPFIMFLAIIFIQMTELQAQETIKTMAVFKKKTNINFSADWQYLSTDLYLLNANKFSQLLNDIAAANSAKKLKKLSDESLQSLFIRAKVKNIKFFGGDIVYPIYNFKVTEDKNFATVETGNVEVVRLIDNLPLNESNEVIDAEISGEAITQKNSNEFLKLIASQLQNFSKNTKPTLALLDLIGELGKFIESKTAGKQYKFSSTIRLYEGQDFNKRLHSVNIFVFVPSSVSKINLLADNLSNFLDTALNPQIDQASLDKYINYKKYPLIITINYKSRYNSNPVIGDQVNYDYLNERKLKIQNAYQNELINKTTYNQELKLIEFLEVFSDLKLNINNYRLNLKNNITNDYSKNLFVILNIYRNLLNIKKMRIIEFSDNPEFNSEFLSKYESVINTAGLYLSENNALTNIKEVADLLDLNTDPVVYALKPEIPEKNLRFLYSIAIPDSENNSGLSAEIQNMIKKIEDSYFSGYFNPILKQVNALALNEQGLKQKEQVEAQYADTYCKLCRNKLILCLADFNQRYQNTLINQLIRENDEMNQRGIALLFNVLEKRKCVDTYMNSHNNDSVAIYTELISIEINKTDALIKENRDALKISVTGMNSQQLTEHNAMLEEKIQRLDTEIKKLCTLINGICDCTKER